MFGEDHIVAVGLTIRGVLQFPLIGEPIDVVATLLIGAEFCEGLALMLSEHDHGNAGIARLSRLALALGRFDCRGRGRCGSGRSRGGRMIPDGAIGFRIIVFFPYQIEQGGDAVSPKISRKRADGLTISREFLDLAGSILASGEALGLDGEGKPLSGRVSEHRIDTDI